MVWPEQYVQQLLRSGSARSKPSTWRQLLSSTPNASTSAAERARLREVVGEAGLGTCLAVARASARGSLKQHEQSHSITQ